MYFEYDSEYQRVIHLRHARLLRLLQNTAYQVVKGHILQSKSVCFALQYVPFRNWSVFVSRFTLWLSDLQPCCACGN